MDEKVKSLLLDLSDFIRPIASGATEAPHFVRAEAEQLIKRIKEEIESGPHSRI